jgi:hypothetical protein
MKFVVEMCWTEIGSSAVSVQFYFSTYFSCYFVHKDAQTFGIDPKDPADRVSGVTVLH